MSLPGPGNVYIFNLYGEPADVSVNNVSAGQMAAPGASSSTPPYAAGQVATPVPRTDENLKWINTHQVLGFVSKGGSANESNAVTVRYSSDAWTAQVQIPDPPGLHFSSDLWLYFAYEQAFLFDSTTGALVPPPDGGQAFKLMKA